MLQKKKITTKLHLRLILVSRKSIFGVVTEWLVWSVVTSTSSLSVHGRSVVIQTRKIANGTNNTLYDGVAAVSQKDSVSWGGLHSLLIQFNGPIMLIPILRD